MTAFPICCVPLLALSFLVSAQARGVAKKLEPAMRHVVVYHEKGRFGGWPANHGIWSWGNEILCGFSAAHFKDYEGSTHAVDRKKPEHHLFARSLDGGETWAITDPA